MHYLCVPLHTPHSMHVAPEALQQSPSPTVWVPRSELWSPGRLPSALALGALLTGSSQEQGLGSTW